MVIVGVSAFYHNSAACVLVNGNKIRAMEEERFSRLKNDAGWPRETIDWCLNSQGIKPTDVDHIAFYEHLDSKLNFHLHKQINLAPGSYSHVLSALKNFERIRAGVRASNFELSKLKTYTHHEAHAAYAFFSSPFDDAAVVVLDGVGGDLTASIYRGSGRTLKLLDAVQFPNSLGLFYSAITSFLGFRVLSDEYKVMGLAAYGDSKCNNVFSQIIRLEPDGQFEVDTDYFNFYNPDSPMYKRKLCEVLGEPRASGEPISEWHRTIAAAAQSAVMAAIQGYIRRALHLSCNTHNVCVAGGVALNCRAIQLVAEAIGNERVYVPPAPGDSGASIGAALLAAANFNQPFSLPRTMDPYLGPEANIRPAKDSDDLKRTEISPNDLNRLSKLIADGKLVGLCHGRAEFGPRSLGNRSIVADPRDASMRDKLNKIVKKRESFRPFGAAILAERVNELIESGISDPFMQRTGVVSNAWRDRIPAAVHVDGTCRSQVVDRALSPYLHDLIESFYKTTGVPALINTSLNDNMEPICLFELDGAITAKNTGLDLLVTETDVFQPQ